jgi:hypothetical protein
MNDPIKELEKAAYTIPGLLKEPVIDLSDAINIMKKYVIHVKLAVTPVEIAEVKGSPTVEDFVAGATSKLGSFWSARYNESKFSAAREALIKAQGNFIPEKNDWRVVTYLEKMCRK